MNTVVKENNKEFMYILTIFTIFFETIQNIFKKFCDFFQVPEYRREIGGGGWTREERYGVCLQRLSQYQGYPGECARSPRGSVNRHESPRLRLPDHLPADQILPAGGSEPLRVGCQIALHRARLLQHRGTSGHGGPGDLQKARHRILTKRLISLIGTSWLPASLWRETRRRAAQSMPLTRDRLNILRS